MPKAGFRSITIKEELYDNVYALYQERKVNLRFAGINSFTGFCVNYMESIINSDKIFSKYMPKFEKISIETDRIILKDNQKNRIAEITVKNSGLFCELCKKDSCSHIGYCYSLHEFYEVVKCL